ncbi:hypothetical protein FJTKL_04132 [Diaporthe vaccinii]|uniref:Uncharacterized protein n=1 Tax=Diaporthe vaccinii TaxID=105482 RepID=A0ABR4DUJ3_9PEZI
MCDWEEFIFGCSCSYTKRKNYCHFARNDPNHQCFGVQVLKKVWDVPEICDKCSQRNNRTSSRSYQPYGQDPKMSRVSQCAHPVRPGDLSGVASPPRRT